MFDTIRTALLALARMALAGLRHLESSDLQWADHALPLTGDDELDALLLDWYERSYWIFDR